MPRRGRGGSKGNFRGSENHNTNTRFGRGSSYGQISGFAQYNIHNNGSRENGGPNPHFSLNDEARNTERHHSWNSDLKLRHSRISFVSAGTSKAEELTRAPQEKLTEDGGRPNNAPFDAVEGLDEVSTREQIAPNIPDDSMMNMSLSEIPDRSLQTQDNKMEILHDGNEPHRDTIVQESFFNDSQGSNKVFHTGFPPPKVRRSPSVADTDSSEEVILFPGRKALPSARRPNSNVQQSVHKVQAVSSRGSSNDPTFVAKSFPSIIDDSVISNSEVNSSIESKPQDRHFTLNNVGNHESSNTSGRDIPSPASTKHRKRGRGRRPKRSDDEAAILADYIANISDSAGPEGRPDSSILNRRDLGDADNDQWQDSEESIMIEERTQDLGKGADGWDSDDLQDFEELSTSSEALDAVKEILSKRERPSGVQYLIVGEGLTIDDARWLPLESFDQAGVRDKIKVFEDERAEFERQFACCELPDDSSIEDEELTMNLQEQSEDLEDERDLEERRIERMTDEQIARLLSKQEELGLGSNSLMLFDGEDLADDMTQETQLDGCWSSPVLRHLRPKPKPINREQTSFPSATAFADVLEQDPYNGFDVMDQERPSLRKIPKGRRGKMALELSDSELEQSMFLAWENDRSKKKKRKQDREELRAQGLLGKKDKIDLKAKYSEGMSMNQVKNEVRDFLLSSKESLQLPPMAQHERKIVHEIANLFKLKSKSIGSGKSRFPVLYRTARTLQYNEEALHTIEATLSSKRFLPRPDRTKKRGIPAGKGRNGGFSNAGISYKDGEIVGATAPELGQENKGRAMLEKMGWSTGTTLGALNNTRGIAQPVTQVVKTGKAGLG